MANNQLLSSARNAKFRNYSAYYSSELDTFIANDLKRAEMDLNNLEKLTKKDKDINDKIERQRRNLQKAGSLEDFRKCSNEIKRLHKLYLSNPSYENKIALAQVVNELENRAQKLNSVRVSQGGYSLNPATGKYIPKMPDTSGSHYSEAAHYLGNNQVSIRNYNDGKKPAFMNTSYQNQLYGYHSKKPIGEVRASTRIYDQLSTPEAKEALYQKIVFDTLASSQNIANNNKPAVKNKSSGGGKMSLPAGTSSANVVTGVWDGYALADHNNFAPGDNEPVVALANTPPSQKVTPQKSKAQKISSPSEFVKNPLRGMDRRNQRALNRAMANMGSNFAEWRWENEETMRNPRVGSIITDYSYDPPEKKKKIKASEVIAKSLLTLARPIINLVKGIEDIGVQAKNLTVAMSGLADALGNPFEEATLSAITDVGTGFTDTAIGGLGAIGGTISGVGGGIGRAANDTWNFAGAAGEGESKGGKLAGALSIVSAGLGIVGGAISAVANVVKAGFGISTTLLKSINKLTLKILNTSPIFDTIKNILNLAFTMAFLPAMTLLGDKLMPVILNLLNEAIQFGDTLANLFTEERINKIVSAFDRSFKGIIDYFSNHSEELADMVTGMINLLPDMIDMQKGLIEIFVSNKDRILDLLKSTISVFTTMISGDLLTKALKFAQSATTFIDAHGETLLSAVLTISKFIVDIANFLTGSGGKKYQEEQRQAQTEAAQKNDYLGYLAATGKGLLNALTFGRVKLAEGGYVPATPGGVPAIIGEGGEGEYVIPESKLANMGGVTVVFSGNVYGMNDFKQQVRSIMNEYTTKANFR